MSNPRQTISGTEEIIKRKLRETEIFLDQKKNDENLESIWRPSNEDNLLPERWIGGENYKKPEFFEPAKILLLKSPSVNVPKSLLLSFITRRHFSAVLSNNFIASLSVVFVSIVKFFIDHKMIFLFQMARSYFL